MKHSKEQPPKNECKIQGIYIHLTQDTAIIRPCPQRLQHITQTIQTALDRQKLDPSLAQKLAGTCSFTATQLFGKVGRAANRALYDHALSHQTTLPRATNGHAQHLTSCRTPFLSLTARTLHSNHHLHRCLLHHRWPKQKMFRANSGRHPTRPRRLIQWLGRCDLPCLSDHHCYQGPYPSIPFAAVHQLPSFHLFPRSLDSNHCTSPVSTPAHHTVHTFVR